MERSVHYLDKGLIDYPSCLAFQEQLLRKTIAQKIALRDGTSAQPTSDYLIFCEHPHVYTLGKSGKAEHLLLSNEELERVRAHYYETNRGGDITYHGPGQLVMYPIFDLDHFFTDIHQYMRFLEEAVILTLREFGISSDRIEDLTGVWLGVDTPHERKIAAMGVKSSRWVTMHGVALNVTTDLTYFDYIVPCGIQGKPVTSMKKEMGREVAVKEVQRVLKKKMAAVFGFDYR